MQSKKTSPHPQKLNLSELARKTGRDRKTIREHLVRAGLKPDRSGRWSLADALPVLEQIGKGKDSPLRDQKLSEEIRKLRIANDAKEGRLVLRATVASDLLTVCSAQRRLLEQKLVNEYPSAVAGMDVAQARVFGRRLVADVCTEMQKLADAWNY